jgi:hypothetical protein
VQPALHKFQKPGPQADIFSIFALHRHTLCTYMGATKQKLQAPHPALLWGSVWMHTAGGPPHPAGNDDHMVHLATWAPSAASAAHRGGASHSCSPLMPVHGPSVMCSTDVYLCLPSTLLPRTSNPPATMLQQHHTLAEPTASVSLNDTT